SGIARSKLRRPASTCASGSRNFAHTIAAASVEFTSPTTTVRSGRSSASTGSMRSITLAVCAACEPAPTSRCTSGSGSPTSAPNIEAGATPVVDALISRLENWSWDAAVLGLGYVGLPLVVTMARAGIDVTGFDVNPAVAERLAAGGSHVDDVTDEDLAEVAA